MSEELDHRTSVLVLLQQAGLKPATEEVDAMIDTYPLMRQAVSALYAVPGARYEDSAITFDPRQVYR